MMSNSTAMAMTHGCALILILVGTVSCLFWTNSSYVGIYSYWYCWWCMLDIEGEGVIARLFNVASTVGSLSDPDVLTEYATMAMTHDSVLMRFRRNVLCNDVL